MPNRNDAPLDLVDWLVLAGRCRGALLHPGDVPARSSDTFIWVPDRASHRLLEASVGSTSCEWLGLVLGAASDALVEVAGDDWGVEALHHCAERLQSRARQLDDRRPWRARRVAFVRTRSLGEQLALGFPNLATVQSGPARSLYRPVPDTSN